MKYLIRKPTSQTKSRSSTRPWTKKVLRPFEQDGERAKAWARLPIGAPNDRFEREADTVAERIVRMPAPVSGPAKTEAHSPAERLGPRVSSVVGTGGRPLSESERGYFEPRFGRGLSALRIHSNVAARRFARSVQARAFATGTDIVLGPGEDVSSGIGGRRLLAHELTHTIQQSGGIRSGPAGSISSAGPSLQRSGACGLTCPREKPDSLPDGFVDYFGANWLFHCGYWGMKEDCEATKSAPQNECFYDDDGQLVDENHEDAGCRGTPNTYDSEKSPLGHGTVDPGGVVRAGPEALFGSGRHSLKEFAAEVERMIEQAPEFAQKALDWRDWFTLYPPYGGP